ncbi:MAG: DUF4238 domain-containing protein [Dehalococcoidia bacterium]
MSRPRTIAHDNHYVPRTLLRRWAPDGSTLSARRLLVSHPSVPEWQRMKIRGLAYQRDLYTSVMSGDEVDEFERWAAEFETPASAAIDKVVSGTRLKREDWHDLARFLAFQDLRTPASFIAQMQRWEREMPSLLDSTMKSAIRELEQAQADGRLPQRDPKPSDFTEFFETSIERSTVEDDPAVVRTTVTLGRGFWLASIRHALGGVARVLTEHQWSIAEPADGGEWPVTDHPVLKLNYRSPTEYDFGGGWGIRNTNLMMPLSPRHLLFVQVGKDSGRRLTFTHGQTAQLRRLLVERAHRWIFATQPLDWVVRVRPRVVDRDAFDHEEAIWAKWHEQQSRFELRQGRS